MFNYVTVFQVVRELTVNQLTGFYHNRAVRALELVLEMKNCVLFWSFIASECNLENVNIVSEK